MLVLEDPAIGREGHNLPRDHLAAGLEGVFGRKFEAATAGDFHADDDDAADIVVAEDFSQLVGIVDRVKFRAANHGDPAFDEFLVEVGAGEGGTIGSDQEFGTLVERGFDRQELDLDRPLAQFGVRRIRIRRCSGDGWGGFGGRGGLLVAVKGALGIAGATTEDRCSSFGSLFMGCGFGTYFEVSWGTGGWRGEFISIAFFDLDRVGRTGRQASTETVTVGFFDQAGFAIDQGEGAFMTADDAVAAAIALFFVDDDDVSFHV